MSDIKCPSQVSRTKPDLKFFFNDGNEIQVSDVVLGTDGEIIEISDVSGQSYNRDQFYVCKDFLLVPGIGYIKQGSQVVIGRNTYNLKFGEHTNLSNQRLISWYLEPVLIEEKTDPLGRDHDVITLDLSMIDKINLVEFKGGCCNE